MIPSQQLHVWKVLPSKFPLAQAPAEAHFSNSISRQKHFKPYKWQKARLVWFIGSPRAQITSQILFRPQPEAWHTAGGSPGKAPDLTPLSSGSDSRRVLPSPSRVCLWWESGCPVIYCLILTALQPWCHLLSTPAEPSTQAHGTLPKAVMSQCSPCLVALPGRGSTVHVQWAGENRRSSVWAVERGMKTHPDESKNGI